MDVRCQRAEAAALLSGRQLQGRAARGAPRFSARDAVVSNLVVGAVVGVTVSFVMKKKQHVLLDEQF